MPSALRWFSARCARSCVPASGQQALTRVESKRPRASIPRPPSPRTGPATSSGVRRRLRLQRRPSRASLRSRCSPPCRAQREGRATRRSGSADLSAAEWIAQAPSSCDSRGDCIPLPLANFGIVSVTHALATFAGHAGTILDPGWSPTALELIEESGRFAMRALPSGAAPSALSSDGASFAVAWQDAITPPDQGGSSG